MQKQANNVKKQILTIVWCEQHQKADQNIQHIVTTNILSMGQPGWSSGLKRLFGNSGEEEVRGSYIGEVRKMNYLISSFGFSGLFSSFIWSQWINFFIWSQWIENFFFIQFSCQFSHDARI